MAGKSTIARGLEKIVKGSANLIATLQLGVNKVLWGNANTQPIQTVTYVPSRNIAGTYATSGSLNYSSNVPAAPKKTKEPNIINSGLFNALDVLNQVDLCNVISYATDNIHIKAKQKRSEQPNATQKAFYFIQDAAAVTQYYIDKYTAFPNTFVGSYTGFGLNPQSIPYATATSDAPAQGGTAVSAYNTYFLLQAITDTLVPIITKASTAGATSGSAGTPLLSAGDKELLSSIPGLATNLNVITDFLGTAQKYTDYKQISNKDLVSLQKKIATLRSVCVVIQTLNFNSTLALVGNFFGKDIRSEIQKLSKFLDPTKIVPTLKQINDALRSFIKIAKQVQGIVRTGQFIIKLALLFYKIFKFILYFFGILPIPAMFSTAGAQTKIQDAKDAARNESDGLVRILNGVNALLAVVLVFVRYLLANTNELLSRLDILLTNLEFCEAMKGSEVLDQLKQTRIELVALREELAAYVINYDSKTDPSTAMFGKYDIRVVDEEVTDPSITNKRRRGIALDPSGNIVAYSDLTFATNTALIIAEVKQRLVALGLIEPSLANIDGANLETISDSINYLDNNDVMSDNLNISEETLKGIASDMPGNLDETQGLGLNAFINNLPGGKKLRQRTRAALDAASTGVKTQIQKEKQKSG